MGITGLRKLIDAHAPNAVRKLRRDELKDQAVAVDISIDVYQLFHVGESRKIRGSTGMPSHHLTGMLSRSAKLIACGVTPVNVFDGPPPGEKRGTLDARKAVINANGGVHVPQSAFNDVERLLQLLGVRYYHAVSEAEAQCAVMCREGSVYGVISEDYDVLAFGATRMIVGDEIITLQDVLAGFGMTYDQFVDLCILCGCDYSSTLPKIGSKRGFTLIKKHGSIEAIIAALGLVPDASFDYVTARRLFKQPNVTPGLTTGALPVITEATANDVCKYLVDSGLNDTKCKKILVRLIK